ncbi:MAG: hypothetical protein JNL36_05685 [Candidatus Kapabacteria bacterium]|jgi:hypothetical protein|nr:hypothetical protein [Candidatus Kapabacteria bacterium]
MQQSDAISVFDQILTEIETTTNQIFQLLHTDGDIDLDASLLVEELYNLRGKQIASLVTWEKDFAEISVLVKASDINKQRVASILERELLLQDILKTKASMLRTSLKSLHQNKNVLLYKEQQ